MNTSLLSKAIFRPDETQRLNALVAYDILDSAPEVMFDELARLAASICDTPIALVSFVDDTRQWFKAKIGLEVAETPREYAFCAHALEGSEPFVVPNTLTDSRFAHNPLVTGEPAIRFYAGAPLITPDGRALGTLCVIDKVPRELSPDKIEALKLLARHVMAQLELRKRLAEVANSNTRKKEQIAGLRQSRERLDDLIHEQQAKISQLAQYNAQTGLANRSLFLARTDTALRTAHVDATPATVFVFDIQRFHLVSEAVGQSHLDELLRQVSGRLLQVFDHPQRIAHLETDRFAALSTGCATADSAAALLEAVILPALTSPYVVSDEEVRIAFKIGIAQMPPEGIAAEPLLRRAKTALSKAKESEDTYTVYSAELETRLASVVSLETKLRRAISREEFELHYQPKQSLIDGTVTGVEALIRWKDPEPTDPAQAWVPPARFIPTLESTGLILEVGRWALQQAARDHRAWLQAGMPAPRIAVNVSPLQLRHKSFLGDVQMLLSASTSPAGLDLELTEAVLMEQPDQCISTLHALRQLGVKVAIDDFGSGYSSLRYIARLPVDILKIDMAFIHAMPRSPDNMAIVSSVISLAHGLRLKTVAEGVENEEQRNLLRLLRCDELQGYLFSKPLDKKTLEAFMLKTHDSSPFQRAL